MKKLISLILSAIMAVSVPAVCANAADSSEKESNDSYATANTLSLDGTINSTDALMILQYSVGKITKF